MPIEWMLGIQGQRAFCKRCTPNSKSVYSTIFRFCKKKLRIQNDSFNPATLVPTLRFLLFFKLNSLTTERFLFFFFFHELDRASYQFIKLIENVLQSQLDALPKWCATQTMIFLFLYTDSYRGEREESIRYNFRIGASVFVHYIKLICKLQALIICVHSLKNRLYRNKRARTEYISQRPDRLTSILISWLA